MSRLKRKPTHEDNYEEILSYSNEHQTDHYQFHKREYSNKRNYTQLEIEQEIYKHDRTGN